MGIYGFGSLRDRFATIANVKRDRYVACFDVTPMVVTAIRNSSTIDEFEQIFRYRIQTCRESIFLRKNPPLILHYTLDNRSPRAKRQTQLQRIMDSQTIVSRVIAPFSDDSVKSQRYDSTSSEKSPPSTRITDDDELSSRRIVVKSTESVENHPVNASTNRVDKATSDVTKDFEIPRQQLRVHDVVDIVRRVLLAPIVSIFPDTTTIEFDYDEGEGEIKVLNWLTDRCNEDPSIDRLVMARDNDVYVYLLSRLRDVASFSATDSGSSETQRKRRRDDSTRDSRIFGTTYDIDERHLFDKSGRYLVYHENSDTVLCCWNNIPRDSASKTWLLQLWLSVCFGNDFVHGLLDKSTDVIQRYYDVLERDFLRYSKYFRTLNSQAFADSFEELRTCASSSPKHSSSWQTIRDDDAPSSQTDSRKAKSTVFVTVDNAIEQIIMALWLLQKILSGNGHVSMESYFTSFAEARGHVAEKTYRTERRISWRKNIENDAFFQNDVSLRYWIARHMWSLFYIMELPQNFTKNQRFACCPAIRINTSFDKPFLCKETFTTLNIDRIAVLARSIFLYGI